MQVNILSEKRVFDGYFKIDEGTLQHELFSGGMSEPITRLNFERGDSVAVLIYCPPEDKVVMVKQFRYPCHSKGNSWMTEIVAGAIDAGETEEQAAIREAEEETGITVGQLHRVGRVFPSPGGSSERITIFYAEAATLPSAAGGGLATEHEDLKIERFSLMELRCLMADGAINDAKTMIACQHLLSRYPLEQR